MDWIFEGRQGVVARASRCASSCTKVLIHLAVVGTLAVSVTSDIAAQSKARPAVKPGSGASFRDCPNCPEMVVVPAGTFTMGSPTSERGHQGSESPQHQVTIAKPFAVSKFTVTFAQWDSCVDGGGCTDYRPDDKGWGRGDRPVINVRWSDAKAYIAWLSAKTGLAYRLLSEAEREYVARAGTSTPYWWGTSISPNQANYEPRGERAENARRTAPVKSFQPNRWGLYQVHGNVWEWVEDCWTDNYDEAPRDGSAWIAEACYRRVLRGGSWGSDPEGLRSASRTGYFPVLKDAYTGFRVARTLEP